MIEINNLEIKYKNEIIVKNINLKIDKGEKIFLIGKSGAGKSSILDSLLIKNYQEGSVKINNKITGNLNKKERRNLSNKISLISQIDDFIEDKTVFNNLYRLMKPKNKILKFLGIATNDDIKKIYKSLAKLKIENKAQTLMSELSGGERKRVQIALSFLKNSEIILADEITSSLDIKNSEDVINAILKSKSTAIIVAHDLEIIKKGHRVLAIKNKGIFFDLVFNNSNLNKIKGAYE
ncbi:MAG: ABC transporter ATP-binding protein [Mycoplasmatales bacterium]|nr:ABC transporter ATP-binding protein [Mycoplasmatales bacterium]